MWSQAKSLLGLNEARVATASVSRHIDKSHLASSGVAAGKFAEFHERDVLEFGKGDNFLPDAQAQNVLLRDDLQYDFFDSSHHHAHFRRFDADIALKRVS